MYSIPKLYRVAGASIVGLFLLGGCASSRMTEGWSPSVEGRINAMVRPSQSRLDPVMADPAPDAATALRGWETETYLYPNGGVVAYPTYAVNYEDRPAWLQNDYVYAAASPLILLADVGALPFWLIAEPMTTEVTYHGSRYPASMTVAPPLPPQQ